MVLRCPVTEEERKLIEYKMSLVPTTQTGAYLRKMAIDGYIIYTDTSNIKAFNAELHAIGRNINLKLLLLAAVNFVLKFRRNNRQVRIIPFQIFFIISGRLRKSYQMSYAPAYDKIVVFDIPPARITS